MVKGCLKRLEQSCALGNIGQTYIAVLCMRHSLQLCLDPRMLGSLSTGRHCDLTMNES